MNEPHWDHLIQHYLDDALNGSELAEFESLMLESASARRRFWELAEIHGVARESARLAWVHDEAEASLPDRLRTSPNLTMEQKTESMVPPQQTELKRHVGWLSWRPLAAAACVSVIGRAGFCLAVE